jgi:hypothetical protein
VENNATAMRELEGLLKQHDSTIKFHHLNNRIRCYLHIINICSSHIVASSTHISKQFCKTLNSKSDGDLGYFNIESDDDDSDDDSDDNDDSDNDGSKNNRELFAQEDIPELTLNKEQLDISDDEERAWHTGLKCDPIKRACRIVCILHLSDQRKQGFKDVIKTRNKSSRFRSPDDKVIQLPDLELLCDVKTRWDSVYCMLEHLLVL